jgi:hypothetical protein
MHIIKARRVFRLTISARINCLGQELEIHRRRMRVPGSVGAQGPWSDSRTYVASGVRHSLLNISVDQVQESAFMTINRRIGETIRYYVLEFYTRQRLLNMRKSIMDGEYRLSSWLIWIYFDPHPTPTALLFQCLSHYISQTTFSSLSCVAVLYFILVA